MCVQGLLHSPWRLRSEEASRAGHGGVRPSSITQPQVGLSLQEQTCVLAKPLIAGLMCYLEMKCLFLSRQKRNRDRKTDWEHWHPTNWLPFQPSFHPASPGLERISSEQATAVAALCCTLRCSQAGTLAPPRKEEWKMCVGEICSFPASPGKSPNIAVVDFHHPFVVNEWTMVTLSGLKNVFSFTLWLCLPFYSWGQGKKMHWEK